MGLFFDVLSTINDPSQQGDIDQLATIARTIEELTTSQQMADWQITLILLTLGDQLSSLLAQRRQASAAIEVVSLVRTIAIAPEPLTPLNDLVPHSTQQQLSQVIAQTTTMPVDAVAPILPGLLIAVIQLLHMGTTINEDHNTLLEPFLENGHELADVLRFANRFLYQL